MSGGVVDPDTGDIKIKNEMKVFSYAQWTNEKLAPEAKEALRRERLAQVPAFKRRQKKHGRLEGRSQSSSRTAQNSRAKSGRAD